MARFAYPGLADELEEAYRPQSGWCSESRCKTCNEARAKMRSHLENAPNVPKIRGQGFNEGYERARVEMESEAHRLAQTMTNDQIHQALARQRQQHAAQETAHQGQWYQRGYREGLAEGARNAPAPTGAAQRNSIVDECLNEVHVIAESNPNMAPGPFRNAVRHRMKKLKK